MITNNEDSGNTSIVCIESTSALSGNEKKTSEVSLLAEEFKDKMSMKSCSSGVVQIQPSKSRIKKTSGKFHALGRIAKYMNVEKDVKL